MAAKLPVVAVQFAHPIIIRGIVYTSLDVQQPRPRVTLTEEQRGIGVVAAAKTPGAPDVAMFVPWTNVVAVRYGAEEA